MQNETRHPVTAALAHRRGTSALEYALVCGIAGSFILGAYTGFAEGIAALLAAAFP